MSAQVPEQQALFYTEGSSDKEYRVELRETAPGQWMTLGFNGRRGGTLKEQKKTQMPVDYSTAKAEYDKTLKKKLKEGYTPNQSGAVYQSAGMADQFSGVVPQLLNAVREAIDLEACLRDPLTWGQEKHDGERRMAHRKPDSNAVAGINKEGVFTGMPMNVVDQIKAVGAPMLLDGELMGERYVVFDLLEHAGQDLRAQSYAQRLDLLEQIAQQQGWGPTASGIEVVRTARTESEKRRLFENLKGHRAEGMVFKEAAAPHSPGRPASGGSQLKYKFKEVCSVRVSAHHPKKRSVSVECVDATGASVVLGNVTIPANASVPAVGAIANVEYLYLFEGGSLYQPTYLGVRTDQSHPDAIHQFKLKAKDAFREPETFQPEAIESIARSRP